MDRAANFDDAPKVWVPDSDWRALGSDDPPMRCRRCVRGADAVLYRATRGDLPRPWAYCHEHMYGREIIRGVVHVQVVAGSPAAVKGFVLQSKGTR
jgi:hypothetical protein